MKEVVAKLRYLRIAPKKVRRIANLLKGLSFPQAQARLRYLPQKSVRPLQKLLASAGANAEQNAHLKKEDLYVARVLVDPGPTQKKLDQRARGRGMLIAKHSSHVSIFLKPLTSLEGEEVILSAKEQKKRDSRAQKIIEGKTKKAKTPVPIKHGKEKVGGVREVIKPKVFRRKAI